MYFKRRYRIVVWVVSISFGLLIVFVPLLSGIYSPQEPYIIPISQKVNNTMAFGLIIALLSPAIVEYNNYAWARQVDRNVPRLLRDVTEAVRSGITLPRALEEASKRDYGPVSKELEHAISKFILGASWEDSLMSFACRLRRPSVLRLSTVLIEAHQTGGKLIDVLEASVDVFSSLDEYREERYTQMKPYTMMIYMSIFIFLIVAYVVLYQFLTPLCEASTATVTQEAGMLGGVLDINYYNSILFWASILESIFGGLVAGKIGDGALATGLCHSVTLSIVTLAFFNVIKFGVV